jgi:hypothetical protein
LLLPRVEGATPAAPASAAASGKRARQSLISASSSAARSRVRPSARRSPPTQMPPEAGLAGPDDSPALSGSGASEGGGPVYATPSRHRHVTGEPQDQEGHTSCPGQAGCGPLAWRGPPGSVRRSIHRVRGGGLIYEEPKSKRSQRTLALPFPLVAELHRHKAAQLGERMLAGSEWHDEDLVFAQPNGRPIDKKSDYDDWRASAAVRRRPPRPSARRLHTAATLLQSENVHPRVVMELLGHSPMRTTMEHLHPRHAGAGPRGRRPHGHRAADEARVNCNHNCNQRRLRPPPVGERPVRSGGPRGSACEPWSSVQTLLKTWRKAAA